MAAAVVLPYVAVVMANASETKTDGFELLDGPSHERELPKARNPTEFASFGTLCHANRRATIAPVLPEPRAGEHRRVPDSFPRGCPALVVIFTALLRARAEQKRPGG